MLDEIGHDRRLAIEGNEDRVARQAAIRDRFHAKRVRLTERCGKTPEAAIQEEEREEQPDRVQRREWRNEGERDERGEERLVPRSARPPPASGR